MPQPNSDSFANGNAHSDGDANSYSHGDGNAYTDTNGYSYVHTDSHGYGNGNSHAHTDANCNSDSNSYGNSDLNADSNCGKAFADAETASNDTATTSVVRIGKWNSSGGNSRETLASSPLVGRSARWGRDEG